MTAARLLVVPHTSTMMMERTEIMAKAAAAGEGLLRADDRRPATDYAIRMQARGWTARLAKKRGGEQGPFQHTLIEVEAAHNGPTMHKVR